MLKVGNSIYSKDTCTNDEGVGESFGLDISSALARASSSFSNWKRLKSSNSWCKITFPNMIWHHADQWFTALHLQQRQGSRHLKNQTKKTKGKILPFVTAYHPGVKNLKQILMQEWNLIQNQPLLKTIYKTPPIISYKRGKSLKDILVRAKL